MGAAEWIAKRRELLADATEGPWVSATGALVGDDDDAATHVWYRTYSADRAWLRTGKVLDNDLDQTTIEDAAFIADARTSLPRALDALEAVLAIWPDADPCPPLSCTHVDCEVIITIETALRADS